MSDAPTDSIPTPSASTPDGDGGDKLTTRLETRLAAAETQIQANQERIMELTDAAYRQRQRALWSRVFLLGAMLAAFFVMRSLKGG